MRGARLVSRRKIISSAIGLRFFCVLLLALLTILSIDGRAEEDMIFYEVNETAIRDEKGNLSIYSLFNGTAEEDMIFYEVNETAIRDEKGNLSIAEEIFRRLCVSYDNGIISGDYCLFLCYYRDKIQIANYRKNEYSITLKINKGDSQYTLRTKYPFFEDYGIGWNVTSAVLTETLVNRAEEFLQWKWPLDFQSSLVQILWPPTSRPQSKNMTEVDRRSLLSLVQQDEYMFSTLLAKELLTPKILGTCGHMYVVENLEPFKIKKRTRYSMKAQARIVSLAVNIGFDIHWCNMGFSRLGEYIVGKDKLIINDGNYLYTREKLQSIFKEMPCQNDRDCIVKTCRSTCTPTGFCSTEQIRNIFDDVCQHLLQPVSHKTIENKNNFTTVCNNKSASASVYRRRNIAVQSLKLAEKQFNLTLL